MYYSTICPLRAEMLIYIKQLARMSSRPFIYSTSKIISHFILHRSNIQVKARDTMTIYGYFSDPISANARMFAYRPNQHSPSYYPIQCSRIYHDAKSPANHVLLTFTKIHVSFKGIQGWLLLLWVSPLLLLFSTMHVVQQSCCFEIAADTYVHRTLFTFFLSILSTNDSLSRRKSWIEPYLLDTSAEFCNIS